MVNRSSDLLVQVHCSELLHGVIIIIDCDWMRGRALFLLRRETIVLDKSVDSALQVLDIAAEVMMGALQELKVTTETGNVLVQTLKVG